MTEIRANCYIHASRDEVFAHISDHCRFMKGGSISNVRLTKEGHDDRDGVGCIREIRGQGLRFLEEIVHFDKPSRMDYQIIESTLPINHQGGQLRFIERGEGTEVDWRSNFSLPLPLLNARAEELARTLLTDAFTQLLLAAKDELEG